MEERITLETRLKKNMSTPREVKCFEGGKSDSTRIFQQGKRGWFLETEGGIGTWPLKGGHVFFKVGGIQRKIRLGLKCRRMKFCSSGKVPYPDAKKDCD